MSSLTVTPPIRLSNEFLSLDVLPGLGARVLNFTAASGRAVFRRTEPDEVPSGRCGAFLMLPYSNRIENARFSYAAVVHQLRPGDDGHARHGDVRDRPWQVETASGTELTCTFDSRQFLDLNWPWAFAARVTYQLQGRSLSVSLTLTNVDTAAMPAGMGLHPYLQRWDGPEDPELTFGAKGLYLTDRRLIPTQAAQAIPAQSDFSAGRAVADRAIDAVYADWDGEARVAWPDRALVMRADPVYSHLVVFTAPDGSLALEPVSHATNAFNLAASGIPGTGMKSLPPGEHLGGGLSYTLTGKW